MATNHNLLVGDSITFSGAIEVAWNTTYTITGVYGLTTFDVIITATANAAATASQSVTVLVDSTKNYAVNSLAGKLVYIQTSGVLATSQWRKISSNTAQTVTVNLAITAAINGTSRFVITEPNDIGRMIIDRNPDRLPYGYATSGTSASLTDTSRNWIPDQWKGNKMYVISGT